MAGRDHRPSGVRTRRGDIAEVISYTRVLTAAERAQVHTYLQNKYAIQVADYVPAPSGPPSGQFLPFFT